jgi:hypothetical protein
MHDGRRICAPGAGTAAEAVSQAPWTAYERRAVLAARTLLRWRSVGVLWPLDAQAVADADPAWLVDVLMLIYAARVAVAGAVDEAPAAAA